MTGSQSRRENGQPHDRPMNRSTTRAGTPSSKRASPKQNVRDTRIDDVRGSPSCTGVGGVEVRKRGTDDRVVTPEACRIRASPPDSGVVPFSVGKPPAPIRAPTSSLVTTSRRSKSCRPLIRPRSRTSGSYQRNRGSERSEMTLPTGLADSRGQFRLEVMHLASIGTGSAWAAPCYRSR